MIYPAFEYELLVYLVLDFAAVAISHKKGYKHFYIVCRQALLDSRQDLRFHPGRPLRVVLYDTACACF